MTSPLEACGITAGYSGTTVLHDVSLRLPPGPSGLALVGESGSGKSTMGRVLLGLHAPTSGRVLLDGRDAADLSGAARRNARRRIQPVFQDGLESLDPRMTVSQSVGEALAHRDRSDRPDLIADIAGQVGLGTPLLNRYPHQLSGGQRQRVALARALAAEPTVLILDEPTSALDVTVQQQVLELLSRVQRERSLSILLITHNLAIVPQLCEEVIVLRRGEVMESGTTSQVLLHPANPYTQALVAAVPVLPG